MRVPRIKIGRPQRIAGVLLLCLLLQCLYVISRQTLTQTDYRYATCGREMWEQPSPLQGYFTTCGNLHGDGTFAYRLAGLPLTIQRFVLEGADRLRRPENRRYSSGSLRGSTWEARHELSYVLFLLHLPFVVFAVWLGGGLWWVSRRLFGDEGGFFSLTLFCFCPAVVRFAVTPNNDVLAMWGVYGLVYTGVGVAHALQGPRRKWRPRILLLTAALGLTAAAHLLAAMVGFAACAVLMLYLAERRRGAVLQILLFAAMGATLLLFASFAFRLPAFTYVFTGGAARFWFSLEAARAFFGDPVNGPITVAVLVSVLVWVGTRRSRYFGNTVPLVMVAVLLPLLTTQTLTAPWLWAMPFLLTFAGGVFADVLETRYRRLFLPLMGCIAGLQVLLSLLALPALARM